MRVSRRGFLGLAAAAGAGAAAGVATGASGDDAPAADDPAQPPSAANSLDDKEPSRR
jgi:hypothetical protein